MKPYNYLLVLGAFGWASWLLPALLKQPARPAGAGKLALAGSYTVYETTTQVLRSNEIPTAVFQFQNLKTLSVKGMDCDYGDNKTCWAISEISPQIRQLQQLERLYLPVNSLTRIPPELGDLPKLTCLDLSDNRGLAAIDEVSRIQSLEQLYLDGCSLTMLPKNIGALTKLERLSLIGNDLPAAEKVRIKWALPRCRITF